jgi:hypothetical protein
MRNCEVVLQLQMFLPVSGTEEVRGIYLLRRYEALLNTFFLVYSR